ncbi:hypothetical protein PG995_003361 [Apiospora arundinis]
MRSLSPRSEKQDAGSMQPTVTKLLENSKKEVTLSSRLHVPYCAHHGDGTEPTPISAITHRCGHRPAA